MSASFQSPYSTMHSAAPPTHPTGSPGSLLPLASASLSVSKGWNEEWDSKLNKRGLKENCGNTEYNSSGPCSRDGKICITHLKRLLTYSAAPGPHHPAIALLETNDDGNHFLALKIHPWEHTNLRSVRHAKASLVACEIPHQGSGSFRCAETSTYLDFRPDMPRQHLNSFLDKMTPKRPKKRLRDNSGRDITAEGGNRQGRNEIRQSHPSCDGVLAESVTRFNASAGSPSNLAERLLQPYGEVQEYENMSIEYSKGWKEEWDSKLIAHGVKVFCGNNLYDFGPCSTDGSICIHHLQTLFESLGSGQDSPAIAWREEAGRIHLLALATGSPSAGAQPYNQVLGCEVPKKGGISSTFKCGQFSRLWNPAPLQAKIDLRRLLLDLRTMPEQTQKQPADPQYGSLSPPPSSDIYSASPESQYVLSEIVKTMMQKAWASRGGDESNTPDPLLDALAQAAEGSPTDMQKSSPSGHYPVSSHQRPDQTLGQSQVSGFALTRPTPAPRLHDGAIFMGATVPGATFTGATFPNATFPDSSLTHTAPWRAASLSQNLTGFTPGLSTGITNIALAPTPSMHLIMHHGMTGTTGRTPSHMGFDPYASLGTAGGFNPYTHAAETNLPHYWVDQTGTGPQTSPDGSHQQHPLVDPFANETEQHPLVNGSQQQSGDSPRQATGYGN